VNNLLGPITAQLSFIMPQIEQHSELGQTLDMVLAAVKRAKQFTSQVVKAAKAKTSSLQPTDMGEIIRDTVRLAQAGSNVKVRVQVADGLKPAMADPTKITQVLQNLVLNGIQSMPSGGFMDVEARNLEMRLGQDPSLQPGMYVEIVVRDRGTGIAPENLAKLFNESFTTKTDGNGIGLTTCKRHIDDHHGAIRVSSTLRVGTEFRLIIPAVASAVTMISKPAAARPGTGPLREGKGTVLIVDDEIQIRSIAAMILKKCGYQVFECDNGETAVKTYQQMFRSGHPLDVVLMDLTLKGGMEGIETSQTIWKFDPGARIIVSSGSVTEDVQRTFLDKGFFATLPKPYEASELSEAVYQAVHAPDAVAA
jgi:CheY-like chemotaxis protein